MVKRRSRPAVSWVLVEHEGRKGGEKLSASSLTKQVELPITHKLCLAEAAMVPISSVHRCSFLTLFYE